MRFQFPHGVRQLVLVGEVKLETMHTDKRKRAFVTNLLSQELYVCPGIAKESHYDIQPET